MKISRIIGVLLILTGLLGIIAYSHPELIDKFRNGSNKEPEYIQVNLKTASYDKMLSNVINSLMPEDRDYSDFEKCKLIHDFIISRVTYDEAGTAKSGGFRLNKEANDPERTLKEGKGICFGYAQLFCDLAVKSGLECDCILGNIVSSSGSGGHAWNIVKIDNKYYHIDVCWDDGGLIAAPPNYEWFLIGKSKASFRSSNNGWPAADWKTYYDLGETYNIDNKINIMPNENYKVNRDKLTGYKFVFVYE